MTTQKDRMLNQLDIIQNKLIKDSDLMEEFRKILFSILDKEPSFSKDIKEDIQAIDNIISKIDLYYATLETKWDKYAAEDISYKY